MASVQKLGVVSVLKSVVSSVLKSNMASVLKSVVSSAQKSNMASVQTQHKTMSQIQGTRQKDSAKEHNQYHKIKGYWFDSEVQSKFQVKSQSIYRIQSHSKSIIANIQPNNQFKPN